MACSRGRADPDHHTTLRLFADSGGYCQRPECADRLFVDTDTSNVHFAEMAHIIAASGGGPRGDATATPEDKRSYGNLILLCANCHAMIDKAPEDFSEGRVREWKRKHVERLNSLFGAVELPDRDTVRKAIEPVLTENQFVFDQYGPNNEYRHDPESELATVWRRKVRAIVLPNNRKVLVILDANRQHLSKSELKVLEALRQHIDDLEAKHIGEGEGDVASRFPEGMADILREERNGDLHFS